jgi:basic membrane protein A
MTRLTIGVLAIALVLSAIRAGREEAARQESPARVAVVLSVGGLGDRSFNDLAYAGLLRAIRELGVDGIVGEPADHAEDEAYLELYAREGYDLIVAVGFLFKSKVDKVAPRYPDTNFLLIDNLSDCPNVRSLSFREHEGSFLVGALAALESKTGTIGFVGGIEGKLLEKFLAGYVQGARFVRPDIRVLKSFTGSFNDPVKGKEKALAQHRQGADVIYQAAGASGNGVIRAAQEEGFHAIGVDANQNYMAPGTVLTSMVKHVDLAVFRSCLDAAKGRMTGGVVSAGIAEGMIGWALDEHNAGLLTDEVKARIDALSAGIARGEIVVAPDLPGDLE